ncbi:MAG: phosphoribosylglycinamide formyltransferase [Oleibacter sp.]|nr:phosphoribosylglycinamide formyltransferase [Thalassolituus sp.]
MIDSSSSSSEPGSEFTPEDKPRVVVLISGSGSNMEAIAEQIKNDVIDADLVAVISNKPEAAGIQKAQDRNIDTQIVDHRQFASREEFDAAMIRMIDGYRPDLIVLAGFMRILTPYFVRHYLGQLLNIHPSLLPSYPGLQTHQRALAAGDANHGATVHFVTEELDGGPNVIQAVVPILDGDDEISLQKRVQIQEHIIYPIAVKWFVEGRLSMQNGVATLDNKTLPLSGLQLSS